MAFTGKGKKKTLKSILGPTANTDSGRVRLLAKTTTLTSYSQGGGMRRVFQTLPRNMRRRAMSHNIRRLPVEDAPVRLPGTKGKQSRRHRRRPGNMLQMYALRQLLTSRLSGKQVWLETHIWHAKRMHMVTRWGYRLADQPTERGGRAFYRATRSHCAINDLSYMECVELQGPNEAIVSALRLVGDPSGVPMWGAIFPLVTNLLVWLLWVITPTNYHAPSFSLPVAFYLCYTPYFVWYRTGTRCGSAVIYGYDQYPMGALGPVLFVWALPSANEDRKMWLFVHPACCKDVLEALNQAIATVQGVTLHAHQQELVRLALSGPQSHAVLQSVLKPANPLDPGCQVWNKLKPLHNPASLPPGCVIGLDVYDPRLSFPPDVIRRDQRGQGKKNEEYSQEAQSTLSDILAHWPGEQAASSSLWSHVARESSRETKLTERAINERRAEYVIRKGMQARIGDTTVPVLLFHRPGVTTSGPPPVHGAQAGLGHGSGWDLLVPRGWGMPFWMSLVYAGGKPGGLQEQHKLRTEQNLPHFPADCPDTPIGAAYAEDKKVQLAAKYGRYPPAKRPNYRKLAVKTPFHAAWPTLLTTWVNQPKKEEAGREAVTIKDLYIVRGMDALRACSSLLDTAKVYVADGDPTKVMRLAQRIDKIITSSPLRSNPIYRGLTDNALVCVTVHMVHSGVPTFNAHICLPTDEDYLEYLANRNGYDGFLEPKPILSRGVKQEPGPMKTSPSESLSVNENTGIIKPAFDQSLEASTVESTRQIMGHVTTGTFSLAQAKGAAIGCCSFLALEHWARN
eukprot:Ihof_evm3s285 gene=Ihof_evmTU3s285